ncbi:MAG TPA: cupredoxin domain-containing protein [Kofleriaceae bacterium]|nr:cupredoxin domain-containing protein [Kofleriaceae bacterium]
MTKLFICLALVAGCSKNTPPAAAKAPYEIDVTEKGFEPADLPVPAGKPVTLVFNRKTDETCAKKIVLDMGDGNKVEKDLPLNKPVEIATTFPKAGKLSYACGMDMMKGTITVQ